MYISSFYQLRDRGECEFVFFFFWGCLVMIVDIIGFYNLGRGVINIYWVKMMLLNILQIQDSFFINNKELFIFIVSGIEVEILIYIDVVYNGKFKKIGMNFFWNCRNEII